MDSTLQPVSLLHFAENYHGRAGNTAVTLGSSESDIFHEPFHCFACNVIFLFVLVYRGHCLLLLQSFVFVYLITYYYFVASLVLT